MEREIGKQDQGIAVFDRDFDAGVLTNLYGTASISNSVFSFAREWPPFDIDGDGETSPLTDGLLTLRYAFGFRGAVLIAGAVDVDNCIRCTAADVEAFLDALIP